MAQERAGSEPIGANRADGAADGADETGRTLRAVADAVLYEGYLLYPYRRSSSKNRVRWQFGVLTARAWAEADGPAAAPGASGSADSWYQQTECLLRAEQNAVLRLTVRFLHLQHKQVEERDPQGRHHPVDCLHAGGEDHLTFEEAAPRETDIVIPLADLLTGACSFPVGPPAGEEIETLADRRGRVVRRRSGIEARTVVRVERLPGQPGLHRLRVRTENTDSAPGPAAPRAAALRHALICTHLFIRGDGVRFFSLIDPPDEVQAQARECRNLYTFPVLAGDQGGTDAMLSSPIILPDHPQVAPESPGDLHDAAEIDEILTLRTMLLTEAEKREARATDPRAAHILERVDSMPPEVFARLHGAIRSLRPRPGPPPRVPGAGRPGGAHGQDPWWCEAGDSGLSPATDSVLVDGVPVAKGSSVRLRPRARGTDAQDMFLAGRSAQVAGVFHDVDGSVHVAVTLEDDPAAELNHAYGRFRYFRPEELLAPATAGTEEKRGAGSSTGPT